MTLIIPKPTGQKLTLAKTNNGVTDPDAIIYINNVENADGQSLELGVAQAINAFVVGCKADGIWPAIKASCILAGARTLAGCLVPLVGTAPTQHGTTGGWSYNRKTGLAGNGANNYLNTKRTAAADPENNVHVSAYVQTVQTNGTTAFLMGSAAASANDALHFASTSSTNPNSYIFRCRMDSGLTDLVANQTAGLFGMARSASGNYIVRHSGANTTFTRTAAGTNLNEIYVFGANEAGVLQLPSVARMPFYSIGEALDLALLDTRVSNLMTALAAAIP